MFSNTRSVTFAATEDGPVLEGILHLPGPSDTFSAAVVCPPHPLMGGTMHNRIVVAVCRALSTRGWAALRFNFRGTGNSTGVFDGGRGEMDDVAGAIEFLHAHAEVNQLATIGYSFGAEVGLRHAARDQRLGWLVGIALIQEHYEDPYLDADKRPKLFIAGERDPWAPQDGLRQYVARLKPPKELHIIPRTDHFFAGHEREVARVIANFVNS